MKYIKKYNENIEWNFYEDETKELPYIKDGVIYGSELKEIEENILNKMKFDLEDEIICVSAYDNNNDIVNECGLVVDYNYEDNEYLIFFYNHIGGHNENNIPDRHAWWVGENELRKL